MWLYLHRIHIYRCYLHLIRYINIFHVHDIYIYPSPKQSERNILNCIGFVHWAQDPGPVARSLIITRDHWPLGLGPVARSLAPSTLEHCPLDPGLYIVSCVSALDNCVLDPGLVSSLFAFSIGLTIWLLALKWVCSMFFCLWYWLCNLICWF